jgi:hypothetical protein
MRNCRERLPQALAVREIVEAPDRCLPPMARRGLDDPLVELDYFVEDLTRPLLLGYIRREFVASEEQAWALEYQMSLFAYKTGFSMGFTYVEEPGPQPSAFEALIESVVRHQVAAVVLPSILHFAVLGLPHDIKDMFERATGARVLLLNAP